MQICKVWIYTERICEMPIWRGSTYKARICDMLIYRMLIYRMLIYRMLI